MHTAFSKCKTDKKFAVEHAFKIYDKTSEVTLTEISIRIPIRGQRRPKQLINKLKLTSKRMPYVVFHALDDLGI